MVESFFFGPPGGQLFGTYHPPARGAARVLTVVCPPLFAEYMRTQLMLRELAVSLAEKGQHVLRFDYRGTGDSFGELGDATVDGWVEDVAAAVREGRELSGASEVQLVGVRAGALLACRAAAACDVGRVVLWDPVADGAGYLAGLRRVQAAILARNPYLSGSDRKAAAGELGGYRIAPRMLEEFRALDASTYSKVPPHKLHVYATLQADEFPVPGVTRDRAKLACNWETDVEAQIMPRPLLEELATCLTPS